MDKKFIRVLSPITIAVVAILDVATIAYGIFAINKIITLRSATAIFFGAIEIFAVIIGILVTKEVFTNGVVFRDDELEFIGIDGDNIFAYDEIEKVETYQDTAASLKKNFIDRHSLLIFSLDDDKVATIDIGLTTKGTLQKIVNELSNRIDSDKIVKTEEKPELQSIFKKKNK